MPGNEVVVSQDRLFTLAMLKKLAAPFSILALIGAATVSSAGCSSTPDPTGSGGAGGTAATSTTTATTTTGGGCSLPGDCPGVDTDCSKRSCSAGVCGVTFTAAGAATTDQTAGDCQQSVCDGKGATTTQNDDTDVLDDSNECTDDVCTAGAPENKPKASGAACTANGGKVCDGASACVECVDAADCASGVCAKNGCIAASCTDTVKNNTETDVDCGGPDCNPCAAGKACAAGTDCVDTICTAGLCAGATCSDAAKNGAETDVDCGGGTCKACGPTLGCKIDGDCTGGSCSGSVCLPTCTDKVKNSGETDVDCGGPTCTVCVDGKACAAAADCKSKVCTAGLCVAPSCTDLVQNGTESDVDCGGLCGPCSPTKMCTKGADCATGVCTGNVCQGAVCNDGAKNGSETDVDCGGMCATKCGTSKICLVGGDCVSSVCTGGLCQAAICGDGVKNAAEACDDGNPVSGDGCSSACAVESGFTCAGSTPTVCTAICGDGIKVAGEQCDDGNPTTGDGCSSACVVEQGFTCGGAPSVCTTTCGDGFKAGAEACDDGNGIPNDGCTACVVNAGFTCTGSAPSVCTAICGDGIKAGAEACDDGNTVAGDGCSATCTVQAGYTCTGSPSVCAPICGDGIQVGAEQCDDGNIANGDCCSSSCHAEAGCEIEQNGTIATANKFTQVALAGKVNGFITPVADKDIFQIDVPAGAVGSITATTIDNFLGVLCSTQNIDSYLTIYNSSGTSLVTNDDVGYPNYCSTVTLSGLAAGSYFVEVKASSLAALTTFAYTMQVNVTLAICGNGIIEGAEECDGGPTCAANCTILPICGNGLITSTETCDDGNTVSGDGCDSTCHFEGGVNETEPNNTQAQANANPVITGDVQYLASIGAAGDKDIFKVTVATGSVVRFETFESTALDCPTLALTMRLFDSSFVQQKIDVQGSSNASGINNCAAIVLYLPAGSYYVQVEKTASGIVPKYVFQARFSTNVGSEVEPNDTSATATALPGTEMNIVGAHATGDLDWYAITVPAGQSVRAETIEDAADVFSASNNCENLVPDTLLTLYNSAATSIASDDNDGRGFCSAIDGTSATPRDAGAHNLAAGTYYLQVSQAAAYNYRLAVTVR
jgi:cysteine-rich repeat protein